MGSNKLKKTISRHVEDGSLRWRVLLVVGCLCPAAKAQMQVLPSISRDAQTLEWKLDWQSSRSRTFFLQSSVDLEQWSYDELLHFGFGSHQRRLQAGFSKGFYRLRYSDLPVATVEEAQTADFDLDGLSNQAELRESRTDPLSGDTDLDGLPDGWEMSHGISPLDDGSNDPANGPDGEFIAMRNNRTVRAEVADPQSSSSAITNAVAYSAGVQAHSAATLEDKDGDGIPNGNDADPLSRSIDWEGSPSVPRFIYVSLNAYNSQTHGAVLGCNSLGDVIASKALNTQGAWLPLAQIPTQTPNYLPIKIKVDGREHRVYLKSQPISDSVSDDGKIVGNATVYFESIEEEVSPNKWISHQPGPTTLAFVWDSWSTQPRVLAHPTGSVLEGNAWDEYAQISTDGFVTIRRRADPLNIANTSNRMVRFGLDGEVWQTGAFAEIRPAIIGEQGLQAFNIGSSNAFCWLPGAATPASLLADSRFVTPNPRSTFQFNIEPTYIGSTPKGVYGLSFWGKTMLRHENQWQEAIALSGATLLTKKGIAFNARISNAVQVWNGGQWFPLKDCVPNKNFSSLYVFARGATTDGRVLVNYHGVSQSGAGFLLPVELRDIQNVGDLDDRLIDGLPVRGVNESQNDYLQRPLSDRCIAFIEPHRGLNNSPAMPDLVARVSGAPPGLRVKWRLEMDYERGNGWRASYVQNWRSPEDLVRIPAAGPEGTITFTEEMEASAEWRISESPAWLEEIQERGFFGGTAKLFLWIQGESSPTEPMITFRIGGRNAEADRAKQFISQVVGEVDNRLWFAYAIAKEESHDYGGPSHEFYNQFFADYRRRSGSGWDTNMDWQCWAKAWPAYNLDRDSRNGPQNGPGGYGIFQVTGDAMNENAVIPRRQIWNWQDNIRAGMTILRTKTQWVDARYNAIQQTHNASGDIPSYPEATSSARRRLSGWDAYVCTAYNGLDMGRESEIERVSVQGWRDKQRVCWKPLPTRWRFLHNSNRYCERVFEFIEENQ